MSSYERAFLSLAYLGMVQLPVEQYTTNLLDHGFVRLVNVGGDDDFIGQAARVSYGNGTRKVRELAGLIDYLWESLHTSPFEQVVFWFHIKCPIFVARQWIRHRTARLNEISGRYSEMKDEFYIPSEDELWAQSQNNCQGSGMTIINDATATREAIQALCSQIYAEYQNFLSKDLARETSRIIMPLNAYTEFYWQMDLHNLLHFLHLRMDSHAQYHIRIFADAMYKSVKEFTPLSAASFEKHTLNAVKFNADEVEYLRRLVQAAMPEKVQFSDFVHSLQQDDRFISKDNRKIPALLAKLGVDPDFTTLLV